MGCKTKVALILFLAVFFSIQFKLTLFGGFMWPFSGHRLFSQLAVPQKTIVQAVLKDSEGKIYFVHPGRAIPIEYSRCSSLVRKLYAEGNKDKQQLFCSYLLKRLNNAPWWAFDEMFPAIRPDPPAHFVEIHFEHHAIEFRQLPYPDSIHRLERRPLFP